MGFAKQKVLGEYREERLRSCKLYKAEYFPQDADSQKIGLSAALFILTPFDLLALRLKGLHHLVGGNTCPGCSVLTID